MQFKTFLTSPLEQFEIYPFITINLGIFDVSITNQTIILLLVLFFVVFFSYCSLNQVTMSLYMVPHRWQSLAEFMYLMLLSMVVDNVAGKKNQLFFPLVFSIFFFVVSLNLIGLVPYSFTVTSHFIVTLALSLSIFIGMNIISLKTHGIKFFSLFLPSGTSALLGLLLVPVEIISYIFKPLSLAIRLFCNMMAGHTLLKVFAGFSFSLMGCSGALFLMQYVPLLILIPLFGLEFAIAIIQAFVFSLLTCIYLNDALNLH